MHGRTPASVQLAKDNGVAGAAREQRTAERDRTDPGTVQAPIPAEETQSMTAKDGYEMDALFNRRGFCPLDDRVRGAGA